MAAVAAGLAWQVSVLAPPLLSDGDVTVLERRVQVRIPLALIRRDWPRVLGELAGQRNDGRVYDRDLPGLARELEAVLQAYRRRARDRST